MYNEKKLEFEIIPDNPEHYFDIGLQYIYRGDYNKALEYLIKAVKINPKDSNSYFCLGEIYLQKIDYDEAIKNYKNAIKFSQDTRNLPHNFVSQTYNNIGLVYYKKQEYDKAIENFDKAIEKCEDDKKSITGFYNNIGFAYYKKGQYDDVIKKIEECIRKNYKSAETYNILANAYLQKGNINKSIEIYLTAIKEIPSMNLDLNITCQLYCNLSIAYANKRDFENAIINIEKAKGVSKSYNKVYNVATEIYLLQKNFEKAFDNALQIYNNLNDNPFFSIVNNLKNLFLDKQIQENYRTLVIKVYKLWNLLKIDIDSLNKESNDNNYLYQYRKFDFLEIVLENKNFWLNPTDYQNDPNEGKAFLDYIDFKKDTNTDLIAFISCFSKLEDNLIMWNSSYSENGKGISIGINIEKISNRTVLAGINTLPSTSSSFLTEQYGNVIDEKNYKKEITPINKIGLYKILYINLEEKSKEYDSDKEAKDLLKEIKMLYTNIIEDSFYKNGPKDLKQKIDNWLNDLFTLVRYLIKFDDYEHEKEYRLLYVDNIKNSKYVKTSTCWKGVHVETEKILFNDETKKDIIFIGPKNNSAIKKLKLEHYLKCTKLDKYIEVKPSNIEFR